MNDTQRRLRRLHRHLIIHAHMLFALWAMGDRAQAAVSATLNRIEETIAEMDALHASEVAQ